MIDECLHWLIKPSHLSITVYSTWTIYNQINKIQYIYHNPFNRLSLTVIKFPINVNIKDNASAYSQLINHLSWLSKWISEKIEMQSIMDNPEKQATLGTQNTRRRQTKQKTEHNMCLTPLYANNTSSANRTSALLQTTGG